MSDDRKTPAWPWIVALLIGPPVLYVASFGLACALAEHDVLPVSLLTRGFFRPCFALVTDGPTPARTVIAAWVKCCGGSYILAEVIAPKRFEYHPVKM